MTTTHDLIVQAGRLVAHLEEAGGELSEESAAELERVLLASEDKAAALISVDRAMSAEVDRLTAERKRIDARARASQWHRYGDHQAVGPWRRPDVPGATLCPVCGVAMHDHGWIDTLEGGHRVCPGDWVITGVKGEHYPCKPDIFAATYEEVTRG